MYGRAGYTSYTVDYVGDVRFDSGLCHFLPLPSLLSSLIYHYLQKDQKYL